MTEIDDQLKFNFQIVSDIHVEQLYSKGHTIRDVITPSAPFLIIAGDLGRVENGYLYRLVVKELCKAFQKVILIPGNHEYYSMNNPGYSEPMTIQKANKFLRGLSSEAGMSNLVVLIDETTKVTIGNTLPSNIGPSYEHGVTVTVYGSTFWSYAPRQHYVQTRLYVDGTTETRGAPILVDGKMFNEMHLQSVKNLEQHIQWFAEETLLVVTHYAPSFRGTLAPKYTPNLLSYNMGCPKNYMYCSSNDHMIDNSCIVAWVYGHTGHNGNVGKLVTNQMDRDTGRKNAVLSFRTKKSKRTAKDRHLVPLNIESLRASAAPVGAVERKSSDFENSRAISEKCDVDSLMWRAEAMLQ